MDKRKQADETSKLIEGCYLHNHMRQQVDCILEIRSLSSTPRPHLELSRTNLEVKYAQTDLPRRPLSSRDRRISKKEMDNMIHTLKEEQRSCCLEQ